MKPAPYAGCFNSLHVHVCCWSTKRIIKNPDQGLEKKPDSIADNLPELGISRANEIAFCVASLSSDRVELVDLFPELASKLVSRFRMMAHLWRNLKDI